MRRAVRLIVVLAACHSAGAAEPATVVTRFYAAIQSARVTGAPDAAQLARLAPFLSDSLRTLLAAARQLHDADVARAPGEKPSFAEGDLFSSLFEGPTTVAVAADSVRGPTHRVTAQMSYAGGGPTAWTDVVVLREQRGHWVIDDIEYGGHWDFAAAGTLRGQLSAALRSR